MNTLNPDRSQLIETINKLPLDVLPELADYLAYLQFKIKSVAKPEKIEQKNDFLLSIVGLGEAEEDGTADVTELKGMIAKPKKYVSIEDMNDAVQEQGGKL